METRANHVWVGVITLLLLAALAFFIVWLARLGGSETNEYDIFFKQSVSGLAEGSGVTFSGVPAGQVEEVALWRKDPEFVRVRISVKNDIPILQGTTATIQSVSFTSPPVIQLDGGVKGAPPISDVGPEGVPVIPTKPGALGELLNSAPLLIERLATLTERLTRVLSDENQDSIQALLASTARLSESLANDAPEIGNTLRELQSTLQRAQGSLEKFDRLADSTGALLDDEGRPLAKQLRETLNQATESLAALEATLGEARPGLRQFSATTLPETEALVRELRQTNAAIRAVTEKLDQEGAASLLSAPPLPDYKPK